MAYTLHHLRKQSNRITHQPKLCYIDRYSTSLYAFSLTSGQVNQISLGQSLRP